MSVLKYLLDLDALNVLLAVFVIAAVMLGVWITDYEAHAKAADAAHNDCVHACLAVGLACDHTVSLDGTLTIGGKRYAACTTTRLLPVD